MYKKEILLALAGFTMWTLSDSAVRFLQDYPFEMITFVPSCLIVILLLIGSPWLGGLGRTFTMPQLGLRVFRGFVLSCSGVGAFTAFQNLDLATAYTFIFAAPFLGKVLSIILNKEAISPKSWGITALGFIGVLVAFRPGAMDINIGIIGALFCAFCFALGYVLTRYIKAESQTLLSMALFQNIILTLAFAYPAYLAYSGAPIISPAATTLPAFEPIHIFFCFMVAIPSIFGSIVVARAFSTAPAAVISPIQYIQILWGALFGALFFNEFPDSWTIAGAAIIVFAGILLALQNKAKPAQ